MISKVVLITGCSSGIGRELAEKLSKNGYTVVATARCLNDIENLNVALKLPLDVTNNESIVGAVNKAIQHFGKIDVLINNAGYAFRSTVEEISDENIEHMFNVNVYGIIRMIRAVVPYMREKRSGKIINISSIAGKMVLPVSGAYCASKFATEALSDALRLELSAFGISVIIVEPGNIQTNFMKTVENNSDRIISNTSSPYSELYKNYRSFNDKARTNEPGPEVISLVVQKAIEASKPKKRYMAGVPAFNRMMTHLGDGVKDYVVKSLFNIRHLQKNKVTY